MPIYRLILPDHSNPTHPYTSGATYPDCDRIDNPEACHPISFQTLPHAIEYAYAHNELPVMTANLAEVAHIIAGTKAVTPDMVLTMEDAETGAGFELSAPVLIGIASLALMLWRMRKRS